MSTAIAAEAVGAILTWWRTLIPDRDDRKGDRAAAAQLRRCAQLLDALRIQQTHRLLQAVHNTGLKNKDDDVILLAVLLSHVEGADGIPRRFARLAGEAKGGSADGPQYVSPQRFSAILMALESKDYEAAIRTLRRALMMLRKETIDTRKFVSDILFFNDTTQRRWNYDYWQTSTDDDAEIKSLEPQNT